MFGLQVLDSQEAWTSVRQSPCACVRDGKSGGDSLANDLGLDEVGVECNDVNVFAGRAGALIPEPNGAHS